MRSQRLGQGLHSNIKTIRVDRLLELVNGRDIVCFYQRTIVACGTCQFSAAAWDIIVAGAVCCRGELFEKLKTCKRTIVDGCIARLVE